MFSLLVTEIENFGLKSKNGNGRREDWDGVS